MLIRRGERYRVYPTSAQTERLRQWDGALRWLWNHAHTERVAKLEAGYLQPGAFDQINDLKALRAALPWLADVPRDVCAQALIDLDKAWQRGFKKLALMPRYKRRSCGDRAPLIAPQAFRVEGRDRRGHVVFPKLGPLRAVVHRAPRGAVQTCALVRDGDAWFACVATSFNVPDPVPNTRPAVGIDRGIVNLVADSDGHREPNLRPLRKMQTQLARAQRVASHRKERRARNAPRSKNEAKTIARIVVLHRKARRQRAAVLHRLSHHYAKNHGVLVVERLDIGNMTARAKGTIEAPGTNVRQKAALNRAILDSGWGMFVAMCRYKVIPEGGEVREVPAAYSSQECAVCGHVATANRRSQSQFECVSCGHRDHADVNAAKVILSRGTHGGAGCGGVPVAGPVKQQLRVARRGTRRVDPGQLSSVKAPAFMPG